MAINTESKLYQKMVKGWKLPIALYGDTPAMRAAGSDFLPKEPKEDNEDYQKRLNMTFLSNYYAPAVDGVVAKILEKPILIDGLDDFTDWLSDIDGAGQSIQEFVKDWLTDSLIYGVSYALVDAPDNAGAANLKEQRDLNIRPYVVPISPTQVIGWKFDYNVNKNELVEVRIKEVVLDSDDDYNETEINQIRRIYKSEGAVYWELHREAKKDDWVVYDEGRMSAAYIPLIPLYTNRMGDMQAETPFKTLAWMNLRHWQSSSDQNNILHVARVPRIAGFGFTSEEIDQFAKHGVSRGIFSTQPANEVEAKYIEADGKAIEHGAKDLASLEAKMMALSLDPLMAKSGNVTATQSAIETAKANSVAQMWSGSAERATVDVLETMLDIAKKQAKFTATINSQFEIVHDKSAAAKTLQEWFALDLIDRETVLKEGVELGVLNKDFDVTAALSKFDGLE